MLIKNKEIDIDYINIYSLVDKKIGIPIFQRFYAWNEKQTEQLLEDILDAIGNDKQLYLLDFIYYEDKGKTMLADGQQRIVTLNLLMKAMNDIIKEKGLKTEPLELFDISYDIISNNDKYNKTFNEDYPVAPFKRVYMHLKEFLEDNIRKIEKIRSVIQDRIFIYYKKCANVDDAFSVFQQINTGGKPLTKEEIIKTTFDQYSELYNVKISTINIKTIKMDLISYYKYKEDRYHDNFDNMAIMSLFNKYITKDKESFMNFKEEIGKMAKLNDNPISYIIRYINRPQLFEIVNILQMKDIDLKTNKDYVNKVILPLCLTSIVLSLKGSNPTNIKYLIGNLIKMIKDEKSADEMQLYIATYIDEKANAFKMKLTEFTKALDGETGTKYQNIKKALLIMDVMYKNTTGQLNVDSVNLEHIYPQKPETKWAINGWPTNYDEQQIIINNIGNYLLLNEEVNKKIKNKYITDKVPEYDKIIPNDLMLQTPINTVDFVKFENEKMEYIKSRQIEIAKNLRKDLPFGPKLIES